MCGFPQFLSPICMAETTIKTGEVNLAKLIKKTKHHPKGRVQLDENNEIKNPKNPTDGTFATTVVEDGREVVREVPRYAGTVKGEDSVWRISMCKSQVQIGGQILKASCPEELYHEMTKLYEKRKSHGKATDDFRPELSDAESDAYAAWLKKQDKSEKKPQA